MEFSYEQVGAPAIMALGPDCGTPAGEYVCGSAIAGDPVVTLQATVGPDRPLLVMLDSQLSGEVLGALDLEVSSTVYPPLHCLDGALTGTETDVDCGGPCGPCTEGDNCTSSADCETGVCDDRCLAATCDDRVANGTEADVDCGRVCSGLCRAQQACEIDDDCAVGLVCSSIASVCVIPRCDDGLVEGGETDVDCGGTACAPCEGGQRCSADRDCVTNYCAGGICGRASCADGVRNGNECAVDCGGDCEELCREGARCDTASECASGVVERGLCGSGQCDDGILNNGESDIDCGGEECRRCPERSRCTEDSGCISFQCVNGRCAP